MPGTSAQESGRGGQQAASSDVSAWVHIDEQGHVTGYTGKTEIGQNIRTSLAQAIADELHVPLDRVWLVMADTDLVPFDQGTFGSLSVTVKSNAISPSSLISPPIATNLMPAALRFASSATSALSAAAISSAD